jgi:hypothetical protein
MHSLVNKLGTKGLLIVKKTEHKRRVLIEKSDDIGVRLEHISRKSLKRLVQETAVSAFSARETTP